jgi:hypothetical protein
MGLKCSHSSLRRAIDYMRSLPVTERFYPVVGFADRVAEECDRRRVAGDSAGPFHHASMVMARSALGRSGVKL